MPESLRVPRSSTSIRAAAQRGSLPAVVHQAQLEQTMSHSTSAKLRKKPTPEQDWELEFQQRNAREIEAESQAYECIKSFARENAGTIHMLWNLGDGCGGGLLDMLAEESGMQRTGYSYTPPVKRKAVISQSLRTEVFERDAYRCKHCGTHKKLSVDHIHPESKGGSTTLDNLQTLCRTCNSIKGVKT